MSCHQRLHYAFAAALVAVMVSLTSADALAALRNAALPSFANLVEKLSPTVVYISTTSTVKAPAMGPGRLFGNDEMFRRFFGDIPERQFKQRGVGSGFIISADGYIVTNNHVIAKADKVRVKLSDGKEYDAVVKGKDALTDLALLKIDPKRSLPFARFGDSDALRVGDWVFAIGNPYGLNATVTAGIVSAKGRTIGAGPYDSFIQTDASINQGNSGGPLFNLSGEVVGINTAILAQAQGIGFSVPSNMARTILDTLRESGAVTRGWLGIAIQEITPDISDTLKLKDQKGVLVAQAFEGEPADKAGIRAGDVIQAIDGQDVSDTQELLRIVAMLPVGKSTRVSVLRDGKTKEFPVIVAQRKDGREIAKGGKTQDRYGLVVSEITPDLAERWRLRSRDGVVVTEIRGGSPAEEAGIRVRDVILKVNTTVVSSPEECNTALGKSDDGTILLVIQRGNEKILKTMRKETN